ncbi:uncharacterized protein LOC116115438 isoform X2 [Pistacia vera]|uniref:uncharacterized protein LOC116115438 isoform X2 n=1 Tax=Pistacia vera TaxID=55513 RepID=UPI001263066F|nr:uncharacterized protein LOC116115438 isoform X2 [Pistacia vera]
MLFHAVECFNGISFINTGICLVSGKFQVFMITSFIILLVWFLDSEKICIVEEKVHLRFVEVEQILHWERHIGQIVVLGGAFSVNGNVNPIAEATFIR